MSPLSKLIIDLRKKKGFRQKDMAVALGYEQSYISALEVGSKGPPTSEFVAKLISVLNLDQEEKEQLELAIARSDRKLVLPVNAPESLYDLYYELRVVSEELLPSQIEMMRKILRLPHDMKLERSKMIAVNNRS